MSTISMLPFGLIVSVIALVLKLNINKAKSGRIKVNFQRFLFFDLNVSRRVYFVKISSGNKTEVKKIVDK